MSETNAELVARLTRAVANLRANAQAVRAVLRERPALEAEELAEPVEAAAEASAPRASTP